MQRVGAATAFEPVGLGVAPQGVAQGIADQRGGDTVALVVDVRDLDAIGQHIALFGAQLHMQRIDATALGLDHQVFGLDAVVEVVARPADQGVGAIAAIQGVVAIAAEQAVRVDAAGQQIVAGATDERVAALAAAQHVIALATVQAVVAPAAEQHIVAGAAEQARVARARGQVIVATAADERVVAAGATVDAVVFVTAHQRVVARRAKNRCHGFTPCLQPRPGAPSPQACRVVLMSANSHRAASLRVLVQTPSRSTTVCNA